MGSVALEKAIQEVYKMAYEVGFDNIRLEAVKNFTKWVRVNEELYLYEPRPVVTSLKLIGFGGLISRHVKAEAIVVNSLAELEQKT